MSTGEARARAAGIAREHDENFPVAFLLAPHDVRDDMRSVYAYCRVTDDIGDAGIATHNFTFSRLTIMRLSRPKEIARVSFILFGSI